MRRQHFQCLQPLFDFQYNSLSHRIYRSPSAQGGTFNGAMAWIQSVVILMASSPPSLLNGALPVTQQATWFTDSRGGSPTAAMLEASLLLLNQAWAQDPDRRAYQQVTGDGDRWRHFFWGWDACWFLDTLSSVGKRMQAGSGGQQNRAVRRDFRGRIPT